MVQQEEGSSSVTSSPLQTFSLMSLSPSTLGVGGTSSPYAIPIPIPSPWVRELKSDERGLYLIHLLINCANHVAAFNLDHANSFLDHISHLASPDGDAMQRIASYFTDALARRILRSLPGLYRALNSTARFPQPAVEAAQARKHFLDLCPFLRIAYLVSNQAIIEAMDGEKMVHVIDLNASDPAQWVALLKALNARPEGPPHLRITGVNEHRELLNHMAGVLSEEAEKLDIPFQFHPVVVSSGRLDNLDVESLRVKTGEALAISSSLQLHSLLACEDGKLPPAASTPTPTPTGKTSLHQLHRKFHKGHGDGGGTLGEMLEKDHNLNGNGFLPSPDSGSGSSSPSPFGMVPGSMRLENFLASLWGLSPKIMVVTEQESNHNGVTMNERFMEALYFYATLFDCLESTVARQSIERVRVEKMLFGEEIKNIIACDGMERKERHEKLERWIQRMDIAGFGRVPLSYYGLLQATRMLQGFGCEAYQMKEENGCFFICWQERPLFSVSAWRCRRFE